MVFTCIQVKIDEQGRYIFLFYRIENRACILANMYLPLPPFDLSVLVELTKLALDKPGVLVLVIGDFNMVLDWKLDGFPPGIYTSRIVDSRLPDFLLETGLRDIWRIRNPEARQYSCFSRTQSTLSRIDLVLGNEEIIPLIINVSYKPRGLSDHSPGTVSLELGKRNHPGEWKLSPFWIELMGDPRDIFMSLGEFIDSNQGTTSVGIVWDTLKTFL